MAEVERLPLPYREVLMLYYHQDCTYQELADALGVSAATINARLTKARAMLRERMMAGRKNEWLVVSGQWLVARSIEDQRLTGH